MKTYYFKILSRLSIVTFVYILITSSLHSQDRKQEGIIDSVIVVSDRIDIPFSRQNRNVQILTSEDIQALPHKSVNELLSYIAGVDVRQKGPNGSQADIGIDGGTFDQTLILIDGVKMSDVQTGHNMMNLPVTTEAIERIEVLKGPAARIYGVNAMMGVINIVTKNVNRNETFAKVYVGSSFERDDSTDQMYHNYGIQAYQTIQSGSWQHLIAGGLDHGNGFRYNTGYRQYRGMYTGQGSINDRIGLQILAGIVDNEFGANQFYAPPNDKEATEQVTTAIVSVKAPISIRTNWLLKPYVSYRYGYDDYIFVRQNPAIYQNIHHTNTWDAGIDNVYHADWGSIAAGINFRNENINSTNLGQRNRSNLGAFLEYQKAWQRLDVNIGLFLNHNTVFGTKLYPGLDIGYDLHSNWRLFFNAGTGQRLPTFTDLYYSGPANLGNDQLTPEYMTAYEFGLKYNQHQTRGNATVFYKSGVDFIDWVRADTTQPWQVLNFTTLSTWGAHLDIQHRFDINPAHHIVLYTGYTYLNPQIGTPTDDTKSDYLSQYAVNSLEHQWIVRASAQLGQHLQFSVANRWQRRANASDLNNGAVKRKQYNLLDVRATYQIDRFTISGDVNNLINVQYIESGVVPLPGRWWTVGLSYRL